MHKVACLLFVLAVAVQEISSTEVVCSFNNWAVYRKGIAQFKTSDIDPSLCTIITYAYFGLSGNTGEIFSLDPWSDINLGNMKNVTDLKKTNPSLKVLAAIGGWNAGSTNFSKVAGNATLRSNFANSAVNFAKTNNFDGIDIDWDYPSNDENILSGVSDMQNYIEMLKELKQALKPNGYLLLASVPGAGPKVDTYDVKNLIKNVDYLNLNLFDLRVAPTCNFTVHHSPLNYSSLDVTDEEKEMSVASGVQHWLRNGANASQLILGIPAYGRTFNLTDPNQHGLHAPSNGIGPSGSLTTDPGVITYQEISANLIQQNTTEQTWDSQMSASYAEVFDGGIVYEYFFSYEDPTSTDLKTKYAVQQGMGGVMLWSLNQDDFTGSGGNGKYPLLRAINNALN